MEAPTVTSRALVVVAKRPAAGATKTRLCPPLTARQAADLYEAFLRDTLDLVRGVRDVDRFIAFAPESDEPYFQSITPDFWRVPQEGGDLGERLHNLFVHCRRLGYEETVIVDSDSPTLPAAHLARAFEGLKTADVVLGPCEDGGYYLIGLRRPSAPLVTEVEMSTPRVLWDTLAAAGREGLSAYLLPRWFDVDTGAGLLRLLGDLHAGRGTGARHTREFARRAALQRLLEPEAGAEVGEAFGGR